MQDVVRDIDLVLDTIGGETGSDSLQVLKENTGRLISVVGEPNQELAEARGVEAKGIWLQPNGEQLQQMAELLADGKMKSVIAEILPLTRQGVTQAHELSESHHVVGKLVITSEA